MEKLSQSSKNAAQFSLTKTGHVFLIVLYLLTLSHVVSAMRGVRCNNLYNIRSNGYNHYWYLASWINQQLYTCDSVDQYSIELLYLIWMDEVQQNEIDTNKRSFPVIRWIEIHYTGVVIMKIQVQNPNRLSMFCLHKSTILFYHEKESL